MTNRITKKLVTFRNPFTLGRDEEEWPAGNYTIETEEEPLDSVSLLGFRRIRTTMIVRSFTGRSGVTRFVEIDPSDLDAALARDREGIERADNEGMAPS